MAGIVFFVFVFFIFFVFFAWLNMAVGFF